MLSEGNSNNERTCHDFGQPTTCCTKTSRYPNTQKEISAYQRLDHSTMETSACWANVVQHFPLMQILIYAVKDRCYPAMTLFWNIKQRYRNKMSLTSRLWADPAQCPRVKLPLQCFSSPGDNLGCLSRPGITWCLQTGMIHVHFFKVYGISLQWWEDVWICHLIWAFASTEQPLYNGV